MTALFAAAFASASPPPPSLPSTSFSSPSSSSFLAGRDGTRRRELLATTAATVLLQSLVARAVDAQQLKEDDEYVQDEERAVRIFEEATASVVCLMDLRLAKGKSSSNMDDGSIDAEVDGTGSGFVWDRKGHIVTNYHVIAKFATDTTGLRQCKVFIQDTKGNAIAKEGKLIGFDRAYDLAVLKVEMEGSELRPAIIGTSNDLRVGQSCFAIGNPYGFEHTLTTGVISGIGREIPSPNGQSIRGALQTDAAINAGNSGGPLIDSYGHVIGVNTATFTRKGTGLSSGVNFAIPVDTVVRVVPYLIVYGTSTRDRF